MDIEKAIIFYIGSLTLLAYCVHVLVISYKIDGVITTPELGLILFGIALAFGMLETVYSELKRVI